LVPGFSDLVPQFPGVVMEPINPLDPNGPLGGGPGGEGGSTDVCVHVNVSGSDPGTLSDECNTSAGQSEVLDLTASTGGAPVEFVTNLRISGGSILFDKVTKIKLWLTKERIGETLHITLNAYGNVERDQVLATIGTC
jgi:hypothetical protein